ncbi:hypothetical protein FRC00_004671 [Tulasnella sp. 408]|nr:hypothetical protein FRC00_004671 [Tulasnella sp. 408]
MVKAQTGLEGPRDDLTVIDNRTVTHRRRVCRIKDNTVAAIDFKKIKAPSKAGERKENETERGLRVADKGFLNTAVITSEITYIDGDNGSKSMACGVLHKRRAQK